jgi:uncharacterized protein YjdB
MPPQTNGETCGAAEQSKRLKALNAEVDSAVVPGGIRYSVRNRDSDHEDWMKDGEAATAGRSKYVKVLRIELTGKLAERYDIHYRVYAAGSGWTAWVKNGAAAESPPDALDPALLAFEVIPAKKGRLPQLPRSRGGRDAG